MSKSTYIYVGIGGAVALAAFSYYYISRQRGAKHASKPRVNEIASQQSSKSLGTKEIPVTVKAGSRLYMRMMVDGAVEMQQARAVPLQKDTVGRISEEIRTKDGKKYYAIVGMRSDAQGDFSGIYSAENVTFSNSSTNSFSPDGLLPARDYLTLGEDAHSCFATSSRRPRTWGGSAILGGGHIPQATTLVPLCIQGNSQIPATGCPPNTNPNICCDGMGMQFSGSYVNV